MKPFLQKIKLIGLLISIVGKHYAQTTGKDYGFNYEFNDEKSSKHFFWTSPTFNTKRLNNFLYLSHTKKDETYFINDFAYINYQKPFTFHRHLILLQVNRKAAMALYLDQEVD